MGICFIFIFFSCDGEKKMVVMHQERPVLLPECKDYFCPIDTIITARKKSLKNCDIEKLCEIPHDEL